MTVFAAASLRELVSEVAEGWSKRTGRVVRPQYDASSTLGRQIAEGAPADVFISAAPEWLDQVKILSRYDWLSNRLVCVVRQDAGDVDVRSVRTWALANEQVPAGRYAKAALAHTGIVPERIVYGANVRDVLSKVSRGGATAGVVYATDVALDPALRIARVFPEESHPKIVYAVGVLTSAGRGFARALREADTMRAARRCGFWEVR